MTARTARNATNATRTRVKRLLAGAPEASFPAHIEPMLAKAGDLPSEEHGLGFELKWDGIRAIVFVERGVLRIESRNGNDLTRQYPELAGIVDAVGDHDVVLDGEIVALTEAGAPSFQLLQSRLGLSSDLTIKLRAASTPVTLMLFDVLHLDGRNLTSLPFVERRSVLDGLGVGAGGGSWRVSDYVVEGGQELLDAVVAQGLEGVMVKRLDAPYRCGSRSAAWTKVKRQQRQEFVIGGFTEGAGSRLGSIGALLLGVYDGRASEIEGGEVGQEFVYVGSVGTGFGRDMLARLGEMLTPIEVATTPFDVGSPGSMKPVGKWQAMRANDRARAAGGRGVAGSGGGGGGSGSVGGGSGGSRASAAESSVGRGGATPSAVHFVEPRFVCEVEFTEFTRDGTLRHPSFQGLRDDKAPRA